MSESTVIKETTLPGVYIVDRPLFPDDRGFFHELFRQEELEAAIGQPLHFVQANHARSTKHTLRGIHIAPWYKLATVLSGRVQAVIVDTRPGSETFGTSFSTTLGGDSHACILIPPGCGNSYLVLSESADYVYMVSDYWAPGKEKSVRYDDPELAIAWQSATPLLSPKDMANLSLREVFQETV